MFAPPGNSGVHSLGHEEFVLSLTITNYPARLKSITLAKFGMVASDEGAALQYFTYLFLRLDN